MLCFNGKGFLFTFSTRTNNSEPLWLPADVDFVARFPSNRRFFRRNRHISRAALRGITVSELRNHNGNEKISKTKTLLAGFLAVVEQLMFSNLIEMAMRSS